MDNQKEQSKRPHKLKEDFVYFMKHFYSNLELRQRQIDMIIELIEAKQCNVRTTILHGNGAGINTVRKLSEAFDEYRLENIKKLVQINPQPPFS